MARIRTIKPEFWTDERVGEVSVSARLLFVACWNFADDHGGIDRSAKQLKAQAFPYDVIDCEPLIQELIRVGLLIEYVAGGKGGKKYLHINGFLKHQKIEHPSKARIPPYEPSSGNGDESPNPHRDITAPSLSRGFEGKGREGKGAYGRARDPDSIAPSEPGSGASSASPPAAEAARTAIADPAPVAPNESASRPEPSPADSEAAWAAIRAEYPAGTYRDREWATAEHHFGIRCDEGVSRETLLQAVRGYRAQQQAKGSIGTQWILSPAKFFTADNWRGPFPLPAAGSGAKPSFDEMLRRLDPDGQGFPAAAGAA